MSAAAGNKGNIWRPTPPQKGSFPLDHDNECSSVMKEYLDCMQIVRGTNAPGCRLLAKKYLKCRMDKTPGKILDYHWMINNNEHRILQ